MSSSHGKTCGPHIELIANPAARVTRCTCGTLHIHLTAQGLTLRLQPESLRHVANALMGASRLVDLTDRPTVTCDETVN